MSCVENGTCSVVLCARYFFEENCIQEYSAEINTNLKEDILYVIC